MRMSIMRSAFAVVLSLGLLVGIGADAAAEGDTPEITARNAIVVDATTGQILYDKGANQSVPMASLTKLFTAFVAIESTPLDRPMTTSAFDLVGEASMGLVAGEQLPFETLLHGALLPSGNDAATAIARNLGMQPGDTDQQALARFMERLNTRVQELGLAGTHLANPHGLDQDGHYSTARDIAALTMYGLDAEPTFRTVIGTPAYERDGFALLQTNQLLGEYPGLVGGKTGVTDAAGYCLMQVAERDGHRIVTVLLGSTSDAWYADAAALLDYGFDLAVAPNSPSLGTISFARAEATQPASAPGNLVVTTANDQTAIVSVPEIANAARRSPWLWILAAVLFVPTSLLALTQTQRVLAARSYRSGGWARSGAAIDAAQANPAWETQPFLSINSLAFDDPDAYGFGETMNWRLSGEAERPRGTSLVRPTYVPSIGD